MCGFKVATYILFSVAQSPIYTDSLNLTCRYVAPHATISGLVPGFYFSDLVVDWEIIIRINRFPSIFIILISCIVRNRTIWDF